MIRAIRVELAKPLNKSWDEFGQILRDQRAVMHRLLNAAILRCVLAHRTKEDGAIQTLAYKEVSDELERFRAWAKGHKDQNVQRFASLDLPGGTRAAISAAAYSQFQKWIKSNGDMSIPSYKRGAPILVRAQEWNLLRDEGGNHALEVKLEAGRTGRIRVAVRGSSGKHWRQLRAFGSPAIKRGDCKIVYDVPRKKWYAILSFTEDDVAPLTADQARALVVHRGVHNFLYVMSTTGHACAAVRGNKLLVQKQRLEARMRDQRSIGRGERGRGAGGHGRKRRYQTYNLLDNKLAAIVDTTCKQAAARVAELARQWGCGLIVIEDYGGIEPDEEKAVRRFVPRFPLAQLKTSIAWVCKREGLTLHEVPSAYISTTCPKCNQSHDKLHNRRTGVFHCECGFDRPADWVAALHMLRMAGVDTSLWDQRLKREEEIKEMVTHG